MKQLIAKMGGADNSPPPPLPRRKSQVSGIRVTMDGLPYLGALLHKRVVICYFELALFSLSEIYNTVEPPEIMNKI